MKFTANLLVTSPRDRLTGIVRSRRLLLRTAALVFLTPSLHKGPARGPFFQLPASEDGGAFGRTT